MNFKDYILESVNREYREKYVGKIFRFKGLDGSPVFQGKVGEDDIGLYVTVLNSFRKHFNKGQELVINVKIEKNREYLKVYDDENEFIAYYEDL